MPGRVPGPIAMTHTHNDVACTVAYPRAAFLVGDIGNAIGGPMNPFGSMGSNGAQLQQSQLKDWGAPDTGPDRGKVNRYRADAFVSHRRPQQRGQRALRQARGARDHL